MTLTKARMIDKVHKVHGLSRSQSSKMVNDIFETLKRNIETGNDVVIRGFGKFSLCIAVIFSSSGYAIPAIHRNRRNATFCNILAYGQSGGHPFKWAQEV